MTFGMRFETLEEWALVAAGLAVIVSLFYILMGLGWRRGEFVMGGRHPRRLPPDLRRTSFVFGVLIVAGAGIIALLSGELGALGVSVRWLDLIPDHWEKSASFVAAAFFGVAGLDRIARGASLERFLLGPVMLVAAGVSALLRFG